MIALLLQLLRLKWLPTQLVPIFPQSTSPPRLADVVDDAESLAKATADTLKVRTLWLSLLSCAGQ